MLIVRSPVRISFAGGGTDLPAYYEQFGGAVLSTAINSKYFYTILCETQRWASSGHFGPTCAFFGDMGMTLPTWMPGVAVLRFPWPSSRIWHLDISVDLFLSSKEIPPGTGLGSSASVCVNILKTLTTYLNRPLSKYDLAERAFHVARNVLGRHVGRQDEFAAAFGGMNFITFRTDGLTEVQPVDLDPALLRELQSNLMLFFTGSAHHSWTILQEQEKSTRSPNGPAVEALHHVRELADRMLSALRAGDLNLFGSLLDEGWQAKKRISGRISNSRIDHLYELARRNGVLGGKITGAGGGGFLLLYCEHGQREAVRAALRAENVQEMAFALDTNGAQVIVNDPFIDGDERAGSRWIFTPLASAG